MKKINVFSTILCTILLLVFAMIFVGCDFSNAGVNNSTPDMEQNDNKDCTHPSTEWKIDKEATCTTTGSKHKECSTCGETLATESISSLGHDYDETIIPPTEEQQGYTLHQCSRCEDNYKDNFVDHEYTEAEYKQMFETNLLSAIESHYNENQRFNYISNVEIELINYETGDVYFTAERNDYLVFIVANHQDIAKYATYEALYENCPTDGFTYSKNGSGYELFTVQEDDLAEEIVEFALTQPELQEYITTNNLGISNYTVINATEFQNSSDGRKSEIVLLTEEGVLTFSLVGVTGTCSSQEEYLATMKTSTIVEVNKIQLIDYYEIPVVTE